MEKLHITLSILIHSNTACARISRCDRMPTELPLIVKV